MNNTIYNAVKETLDDLVANGLTTIKDGNEIMSKISKEQGYVRVKSSNIEKIRHDGDSLFVVFKNGEEYQYFNFPEKSFEEFVNSESIGKFFHTFINKKFKFKKC